MIYGFTCDSCFKRAEVESRPFHPPPAPFCSPCGAAMRRLYNCHIDTSGCKDHDEIPEQHRIACGPIDRNLTSGQAEAIEAKHQREMEQTRKQIRDGGNKGSFKLTRKIPAPLFHGKIKQTGDRHYWDDPKNLKKHKSTEI